MNLLLFYDYYYFVGVVFVEVVDGWVIDLVCGMQVDFVMMQYYVIYVDIFFYFCLE